MNILKVINKLALLLFLISCFMVSGLVFAWYYQETVPFYAFLKIITATIFITSTIIICTLKLGREILTIRECFLFVVLGWILASSIGALPHYLSGAIPSYTDAYFETMSGFTTTGASILTDIESLPKSLLFWRSMTHWLGGMGIIVLAVALFSVFDAAGYNLISAEAPGPTVDKISFRIEHTAKILWLIYVGLSIAETTLLMVGGLNFFEASTHTFGTMATGGFSPKNLSVGNYNSAYVDAVVTFFMLLAGMNFVLHFKILSGRLRDVLRDTELKAYILIYLSFVTLAVINLYSSGYYETIGKSIRYASFQVASIITTTGFATTDFEKWPFFSQGILLVVMFIGGCTGSTGGGPKVLRIVAIFKKALLEMKRMIHRRGEFFIKINGHILDRSLAYSISGFFVLYIFTNLIVALIVSTDLKVSASGTDLLTSLISALVTVGNIGPGFGKIGPTENYAFFSDYVKWTLSLAMMLGRLELYTVFVLFTPAFWRK